LAALLLLACATTGCRMNGGDAEGGIGLAEATRTHDAIEAQLPDEILIDLDWALKLPGTQAVSLHLPPASTGLEILLAVTRDNGLVALDRETGTARWWVELASAPHGAPQFSQYAVYAIVENHMVSIDARSGLVRWKLALGFPATGHFAVWEPLEGQPNLAVPAINRIVHGLTVGTRTWPPAEPRGTVSRDDLVIERYRLQEVWRFATEGLVEGPVAYDDDYVFVADTKRGVYALNTLRVGAMRVETAWQAYTQGPNSAGVVAGANLAFVGSRDRSLTCYSTNSGGRVWRKITGYPHVEQPTVGYDPVSGQPHLFANSLNGPLFCFDGRSGEILWQLPVSATLAAMVDQRENAPEKRAAAALFTDTGLALHDLRTGETIWQLPASLARTVAENPSSGSIYAVSGDGRTVFALERP